MEGSRIETAVITVVLGIAAVATLATLVSQSSQTAGITGAAGTGLANALCVATSPITGSTCNISSGYVTSSTINWGNVLGNI
jgi:uncharacterized membrane protein